VVRDRDTSPATIDQPRRVRLSCVKRTCAGRDQRRRRSRWWAVRGGAVGPGSSPGPLLRPPVVHSLMRTEPSTFFFGLHAGMGAAARCCSTGYGEPALRTYGSDPSSSASRHHTRRYSYSRVDRVGIVILVYAHRRRPHATAHDGEISYLRRGIGGRKRWNGTVDLLVDSLLAPDRAAPYGYASPGSPASTYRATVPGSSAERRRARQRSASLAIPSENL
jgi:hypothetical protein